MALAIAQTGLMSVESGVMAFDVALRDAKVTRLDVRNAADLLDNRPGQIRSRGWEVVRVTDELLNRPKDLHARVQAALERASRLKRPPSTAA